MRTQRLMGAALVAVSWLLLFLTASGSTLEEQDATAALLILPLGLYLIFTEETMIP